MLHHTRTFEEKRRRSRSADPSRRFRKTDIFFNSEGTANAPQEVSEYAKAFAWPKSQLDSLDEETMKRRLNPCQKQHAAGLSSRKAALNNKAHVIVNSNGSSSIVIANEPTDYALTTGSATNLATLTSSLTQDAIRPLTSMALVDAVDLNKSGSSNGSHMNKSVTITNGINDYANHSADELGSTGSAKKQPKDPNNNISAAPPVQNGLSNGQLNEELLLEKFAKLNTYESIYGKKAGATTLFQRVEVVSPNTLNKMSKKSEYKSKLKPFAQYAYIPGKGWFKPKKIKAKEEIPAKQIEDGAVTPAISIKPQETSSVKSQAIHSISNPVQAVESKAVSVNGQEEQAAPPPAVATPARSAGDEVDAAVEDKQLLWYREAMERKLKANEFRYRSEFGNPILGRSSLEEVYKRASGNHWQASSDPKFAQLQQMRSANSAFLPYDQHKKRLQEDKPDGKIRETTKAKATPSKSPRAKSVPPRKKSTGSTTPAAAAASKPAAAQQQPAKVWIKPKAKETTPTSNGEVKKVQRPAATQQNNLDKELKQAQQKPEAVKKVVNGGGGRASPPIIQAGPVRTTQIKTPEDLLVGIKSPPPENFIDRLDNEPINWTHSTASPSLNSNATFTNYNPTSIRSDNLADLSGLKI